MTQDFLFCTDDKLTKFQNVVKKFRKSNFPLKPFVPLEFKLVPRYILSHVERSHASHTYQLYFIVVYSSATLQGFKM